MKRNNLKPRKLHLDAQTLRKLTPSELESAAGGAVTVITNNSCMVTECCSIKCPSMRCP
jgi:hypothetical protein